MDRNHMENEEAAELAGRLAAGEGLPVLDPGWLVLDEGEVLHAYGAVGCWWFGDMPVDAGAGGGLVAFGRPVMFAATALTSWLMGRARRERAERLAAPQWRRLGPTSVYITSERVLLCTSGEWGWMWLNELVDATPGTEAGRRLWLTTRDETPLVPFVLEGPCVAHLTVALGHLLAQSELDAPAADREGAPVGYCAHRGA